MEKLKMWLRNTKTIHHRIMVRYLRKRGWVVFYLELKNRVCDGETCWVDLYNRETYNE